VLHSVVEAGDHLTGQLGAASPSAGGAQLDRSVLEQVRSRYAPRTTHHSVARAAHVCWLHQSIDLSLSYYQSIDLGSAEGKRLLGCLASADPAAQMQLARQAAPYEEGLGRVASS
jgi:hypothetical protein